MAHPEIAQARISYSPESGRKQSWESLPVRGCHVVTPSTWTATTTVHPVVIGRRVDVVADLDPPASAADRWSAAPTDTPPQVTTRLK